MCTTSWTCFEVVLSWAVLWQAGAWREELIQLLELLAERADRRLHPLPWTLPVPLRVHGHYTRGEIEAAFGVLTTEAPWIHREGVLWHQASATDLLFITLRKSEALFSPSTRYRDLALGLSLFHWESQSTTTASSPTGQRYIHHATRGSKVLLYRYAEACGYVRARATKTGRPPRRPHRTLRVRRLVAPPRWPAARSCELRRPRRRAADGDSLAAGAGDPGGVAARLLCCTPAIAWHNSGVGGLRPARLGQKD
jgi:hypothetical protein